jgi:hypothetical protein
MEINRMVSVLRELPDKKSEQGRFSQSGMTDDEGDFALVLEEFESCQSLIEALIAHEPFNGGFFGKGVVIEGKMVKKHDFSPF